MIEARVLEREWQAALAHAGLDAARVRRYDMEAVGGSAGGSGAGAAWFPPGDDLRQGDNFPDASQLHEANAPENINLHRIVVRVDDDVAVTAARMRHELEHARQYDALRRSIFLLYDFLLRALAHRVGGLNDCAGHLINAIPSELDANAAASMHLRARHPDQIARICASEHQVLACSLVGPEPFKTLPARMVAFAYIHRGRCEEATVTGMTLAEILDDCYEGASELWVKLDEGLPGT